MDGIPHDWTALRMTKILVIEDEALIRDKIVTVLKYENYDVIDAPNGRDGVVSAGMRGVAADWGPFHSRAKREDMKRWMRKQPYCVGLTQRPKARPAHFGAQIAAAAAEEAASTRPNARPNPRPEDLAAVVKVASVTGASEDEIATIPEKEAAGRN